MQQQQTKERNKMTTMESETGFKLNLFNEVLRGQLALNQLSALFIATTFLPFSDEDSSLLGFSAAFSVVCGIFLFPEFPDILRFN